jgi:hypothetical protein
VSRNGTKTGLPSAFERLDSDTSQASGTILPALTEQTASFRVLRRKSLQVEDIMDGSTVGDLKSVVAPLHFLVPMAEKPVAYNYNPPPGVPVRTGKSEEHQVPIRDARPLVGRLSLDKEGFVLLHHQTAVKNFYDEDEIASVYYPECERVVKEATGAVRVVAFDHIVRNAGMSGKDNSINYRPNACMMIIPPGRHRSACAT